MTDVLNPLSSSEIPKSELMSVGTFLSAHAKDIEKGKYNPSILTRRLAVEVMFGRKVLMKCTPFGKTTLPGLPVAELNLLKQTVFDCSPAYWESVESFEREWSRIYLKMLGSVCSKLRRREAHRTIKSEASPVREH